MNIYIYNKVRALLWTMTVIMGLCSMFMVTACSSDDVEEEGQPGATLHLLSCSTRAGDETSTFAEGANLWLALTQGTSDPAESATGTYIYSTSTTSKWTSDSPIRVTEVGQYYLYGVYTKDAATCTIAPSTDYETGAILTISGLPAISKDGEDPCVVVGVQGVPNPETAWSVTEGSFGYTGLKKSSQDNVHLLLDHLYASLSFSFEIDSEYAKLRKVLLKKLEVEPQVTTLDDVKLTVTLLGNNTDTSPIYRVTAAKEGSGPETTSLVLFENSDGHDIAQAFNASDHLSGVCFAAFGSLTGNLKLTSTYDVYDRKDNLIDENRKSVNTLEVYALFGSEVPPAPGIRRPVKLMVTPTYLYILSEPDLDNPTITIGN